MIDYPQFSIVNADNLSFDIDHSVLDRVKRKEFGRYVGISVLSRFEGFDKGLLPIVTNIKLVGLIGENQFEAVDSFYVSIFQFSDQRSILLGVNEDSVRILQKCHQLAQAHAYSIFSLLCKENGVPQSGMELTPEENSVEGIEEFLEQIALPAE
ncbi:hypothetical protein [Dyadobacter bucti]|uniref:hypothetical protein n=1 Tax=Dyadobacter bucti TaxID=2572203 RepID=UPI00110855AA|nr:hypothetical protein [Dyadobacter bucti]